MLWTFVLKIGLLLATTTLVTWLPFIAGISLILIRAGWLVKIYIIDEKKLEDKRTLIKLQQALINYLEGLRDHMDSVMLRQIQQDLNLLKKQILDETNPSEATSTCTLRQNGKAVVEIGQALNLVGASKAEGTPSKSTISKSAAVDQYLKSVAK